MIAAFGIAILQASKSAPHTSEMDPPTQELDQPIPSSPLMPAKMWQDWDQDFALFDQGVVMDPTQRGFPQLSNSNAADGFDTFAWPEPDMLLETSTGEHPCEPSQDGISPLSTAYASDPVMEMGQTRLDEVAVGRIESWTTKVSGQPNSGLGCAQSFATTGSAKYAQEGERVNKRRKTDGTACTKEAMEKDPAGDFEVRRRAKNRIAATKSRAKSKRHHGILQNEYQQSLSQNSALKQQEQALRETAAFLKDCLLQHNSSSCSCKCLHQFNKLRAESIARGIVSPGGKSTA